MRISSLRPRSQSTQLLDAVTSWSSFVQPHWLDVLDRTPFLTRCREGSITREELHTFVRQQYYYSSHFTRYLSALLANVMDEADRRDIATLQSYPENTVGALMTTDYAWLPPTLRAAEAVERLRQQAPNSETIYYIYVLDEASRKLLGVVSLRDLILAPRNTLVRDLMEEEVQTLRATDDRERTTVVLFEADGICHANNLRGLTNKLTGTTRTPTST